MLGIIAGSRLSVRVSSDTVARERGWYLPKQDQANPNCRGYSGNANDLN
jgi:hypothetical protein